MASSAETPTEPPLSAEQVFDSVGPAYEAAFADLPEQAASLKWLLAQLSAAEPTKSRIVDIGSGTGRPVCAALADAGHDVLGIDVSGAMVTAARERVPGARFEQIDARAFVARTPQESYDAVTIYFSLIADVTQDEIRDIIAGVYSILKPGGLFIFATVPLSTERTQIKWMGRPVVVSSLGPEEAVEAAKTAGFTVEHHSVTQFMPKAVEAGICKADEVWEEPHLFLYARKPVAP